MSLQQEIIKTALLGTSKLQFRLSGDLAEIGDEIFSRQEDKEDAFLKSAALAFMYEESGMEAREGMSAIAACPFEEREELKPEINQGIEHALFAKDDVLFEYLISRACQANKVVAPKLVPALLNKALEQRKKARRFLEICGEAGKWLCGLNPAWQSLSAVKTDDPDWDTGSFEERKQILARLRSTEPAKALDLLQTSFEQENANNRTEFIELLATGISLNDQSFLLQALKDKSKKVKDAALRLLQSLQGSAINDLYLQHLLDVMSVSEERSLLLLKKKVLSIDAAVVPSEDFFANGIEKMSSLKGVEDHVFWIAQILAYIDPARLAGHFNLKEEDWLKLLLEHKHSVVFIPWLTIAAKYFADRLLAKKLLEHEEAFDIDLLKLFPHAERMDWYDRYLESRFGQILEVLLDDNYLVLPPKLAERIVKRLAANPYQTTQPSYQRLALSMPACSIDFLKKYAEESIDDYQKRYFSNQASNMLRYIELRETLHF